MSPERDSRHLREYLKVIKKRQKFVLKFFLIVLVLVLAWTFSLSPQYEGVTKIIIEKVEPSNLTGKAREERADETFYQTQYQLIKSKAVASKVVDMLSLEEDYEAIKPLLGDRAKFRAPIIIWAKDLTRELKRSIKVLLNSDPPAEATEIKSRKDKIAAQLSRNLKVQPVMKSNITAISFLSPSPEFSALIANSYAAAYLEETLSMKMEATRRNLEWMTKKAAEEREKLEKREAELQSYMKKNDLVALENKVSIVPQQLAQLSRDLVVAEARRKELGLLYRKVNKVANNLDAAEAVLSITEGNTLQVLRAQILKAEQYIMELSNKYGKKHPSMIKAQSDLNILRDKRRQEIRRLIQKVRDQYELASSTESSLRAQLEQLKAEAIGVNEKFVQYGSLQREIETNHQLYNKLLAKIKDHNITGETQPVNLWIVEKASIPSSPAKPWVSINIMLGMIVGLFGALTGAFVVDYMDNTIKSPEEAEETLGIPLLGVVSLKQGNRGKVEEIVTSEPHSAITESYNHLRTSLQLSAADNPPRKILVTSSVEGEGKTTTAANLALSMAKAEKRVLLIDGDLRRPRVHKVFKLNNKNGLSSYLAGSTGNYLLQKGPLPNLSIITSGPSPPNPSELLSSNRFRIMISKLSSEYDVIICDSPPTLSVTDPRALSQFFDGTLLVIRGGKTTYPLADRAIRHLREVNSQLLGMVINGLDLKKHADYYHEYYYYGSQESAQQEPKSHNEAALKVSGAINRKT